MSARLDFRILGPLEVQAGDRKLRLGGVKQKALLAVLLLRHGDVVSSDRLIEEIWGDDPPADAQTALQAHVSRLRKLLEPEHSGAPTLLITRAPGYVLSIDPGQLDVRRFETLVAAGRRHLDEGDPGQATARVREALELWRGRPLADLENEPFAASTARELDEAWLEALETRVEADLALGRHAELTPELTTLVRRHPLRERLRAQLMLALYRSGRQADALGAFDDGRRLLGEELGLEPGMRLRRLQAEILAQDPRLDLPAAPNGPPSAGTAGSAGADARGSAPPRARPGRRPRWPLALAAAAAVAGAAWLLVLAGEDDRADRTQTGALVRIEPRTGAVSREVPVGSTPAAVAVGEGAVWALDADARTVSKVDRSSFAVATFGTGTTPTDIAAGAGGVWVLGGETLASSQSAGPVATALARVDPTTRTVRARIGLPRAGAAVTELAEDHVAVERDAVWAIASDYSVVRIDPRTNRIVATIRGLQARAVAAGDGVWVLGIDGTIARIDRRSNRIATRGRIGASAVTALAVGGGAAWVSAPGDGTVWRVQPGPRLVMRTIDVGTGVGDLAFGGGSLWVTNPLRGTLARIDPAANRVAQTVRLGGAPRAVSAAADGVWVAVAGDRRSTAADVRAGAPVHGSCEPTFFGGGGRPDRLIVSDLPLQGGVRISAQQMAQAASFVLRRRGFRAGDLRIGLQSCDDSLARTGHFDPAKCAANARAYARDARVIAVIGTLNSPCTAAALPELARAPGGPLAMVSPLNSSVSLTRPQPGAPAGELRSFYPGGRRHFARVFPTDDHQAVALAALAVERLDARRVAVLDDGDLLFGRALADRFATAARSLGADVVARRRWDPETGSYRRLAAALARTRPDAVFLSGILDANGAAVLRDVRRALGPQVEMLLTEGFTGTGLLAKQAAAAAEGAYVSVSGLINQSLPPAGRRFVDAFGATLPGVDVEPSAVYTAEATGVLLDAVAASDGTRAGVRSALFETELARGLTGRVRFDRNGDVVAPPITILRIRRGSRRLPVYPDAEVARVVRSR